jgi:uncharacterized protein YbjQ (UPF0145 family)
MAEEIYHPQIPVVTTFDPPPGWRIHGILGPCWGITVRSRSIGGQFVAGLESMVGGEITMYTELAGTSRNHAMQRLEQHAIALGANMVLAMRFDSSDLGANMNEIVAYGTAVVVVPDESVAQAERAVYEEPATAQAATPAATPAPDPSAVPGGDTDAPTA